MLNKLQIIILSFVVMTNSFSIDAYIPGLEAIKNTFHINESSLHYFYIVYLSANVLSMILFGLISDLINKKTLILLSLGLYCLTGFFASVAPSFSFLLVTRFLEGMSTGGFLIVTHAFVREIQGQQFAKRTLSSITLVFSIFPSLVPYFGNWTTIHFGWRAVFLSVAMFGLLLIQLSHFYLPNVKMTKRKLTVADYFSVLCHKRFILNSISLGLCTIGFSIYIGSCNHIVTYIFKLGSEQFYWVLLPLSVGAALGSIFVMVSSNRQLKYAVPIGYIIMFIGSGMNQLWILYEGQSLIVLSISLIIFSIGLSILTPVVIINLISEFPTMMGTASSVQTIILTIFMMLSITFLSPLSFHSLLALSTVVFCALTLSFLISITLGLSRKEIISQA